MVFLRRICFKTGINPSLLSSFPTDGKYTGTQKLLLVQSRIFGTKIGGVHASGVGVFRRPTKGRNMLDPMKMSAFEMHRYFPWLRDRDEINFRIYKAKSKEEIAKKKLKQQELNAQTKKK